MEMKHAYTVQLDLSCVDCMDVISIILFTETNFMKGRVKKVYLLKKFAKKVKRTKNFAW